MLVVEGIYLIKIVFISTIFTDYTKCLIGYVCVREKLGTGFQEFVMEI